MGPNSRDVKVKRERLRKILEADPDVTYAQLQARGFSKTMIGQVRRELGLGRPVNQLPTPQEAWGAKSLGRAVPFNHEPGRYRQRRFGDG